MNFSLQFSGADGETLKLLLFSAAAALYGLYLFFRSLPRYLTIHNTPRSLLRSAAQGYVEIHGVVHPLAAAQLFMAPVSQNPCVWFEVIVEKLQRDSKGNSCYVKVAEYCCEEPFRLRDATGDCLVQPRGAEVQGGAHSSNHSGLLSPQTAGVFSPAYEKLYRNYAHGIGYRYRERYITEGEHLYVIGNFHTQSADVLRGRALRERLQAWKRDQAALLSRFDANRDGNLDSAEWEAARAAAKQELLQQHLTDNRFAPLNIVSCPEDKRQHFIVSTLDEHKLLKKYRNAVYCGAALFLIGGGFCVWLLTTQM